MIIHFDDTELDITVDDDSYRNRTIMGDNNITLHYSLAEYIELPVGAWCEFQNVRYTLMRPENFKKKHSRNFEYTVIMEAAEAKAKIWKFRNTVDGRLKFPLTAKPHEHLQMFVDNMNRRDSGWTVGDCIEGTEVLISYDHAFCYDALAQMASELKTEFEIEGKTVSLRKVEYNKNSPLALSYGRGNGFKPGVGRANFGDKVPVEILFAQGGSDNIDRSKYGSSELLMPKNQQIAYDGEHFEDEDGFNIDSARTYIVDDMGLSIRRADRELTSQAEDSLDCSEIYPKRVGTVSAVVVEDADNHFYDIVDSSIPAALDYEKYRIGEEPMTIRFQSGMLVGKEFDIQKYYHEAKGEKAARRFEIVPQEIDGQIMPNDTFAPAIGDTYAIFNCTLPDAYICDNSTKTGAEWDMFRAAVRYMFDNEEMQFSFTGELDGLWAKKDWVNIGGRIRLGGYIRFSDEHFQQDGVLVRITGIKDYINNPHSPELTLSNSTVTGSFSTTMRELKSEEVVVEDNHRSALQFTKRRFRDAKETMKMLEDAMLDNFTNSISPLTVQTMMMLVGDESLQFRFVNSPEDLTAAADTVSWNNDKRQLTVGASFIQHMTIGIKDISSSHADSEYKIWALPSYVSAIIEDGTKKFYLYAKVSETAQTGEFLLSETAIGMEDVSGYYHLLVGVLNSEYDGARSYVSLYGFSEILPGRITTDRIVSSDGKTYFDLLLGEIGGRINFIDGLLSGLVGIGNDNGVNAGMNGIGTSDSDVRIWAGAPEAEKATAPYRVLHDGTIYASKGIFSGFLQIPFTDIDKAAEFNGYDSDYRAVYIVKNVFNIQTSSSAGYSLVLTLPNDEKFDGVVLNVFDNPIKTRSSPFLWIKGETDLSGNGNIYHPLSKSSTYGLKPVKEIYCSRGGFIQFICINGNWMVTSDMMPDSEITS